MNTPNTKQQLATVLNALAALKSKLETLSFSVEERDVLTELLSQEEGREARRWLRARAEQAVSLLFPTWRGGRIEKPQHPEWHRTLGGGMVPASNRSKNAQTETSSWSCHRLWVAARPVRFTASF